MSDDIGRECFGRQLKERIVAARERQRPEMLEWSFRQITCWFLTGIRYVYLSEKGCIRHCGAFRIDDYGSVGEFLQEYTGKTRKSYIEAVGHCFTTYEHEYSQMLFDCGLKCLLEVASDMCSQALSGGAGGCAPEGVSTEDVDTVRKLVTRRIIDSADLNVFLVEEFERYWYDIVSAMNLSWVLKKGYEAAMTSIISDVKSLGEKRAAERELLVRLEPVRTRFLLYYRMKYQSDTVKEITMSNLDDFFDFVINIGMPIDDILLMVKTGIVPCSLKAKMVFVERISRIARRDEKEGAKKVCA